MESFKIDSYNLSDADRIGGGATADIYRISEDKCLKIFNDAFLDFLSERNWKFIEEKLDLSDKYTDFSELVRPTGIGFDNKGRFKGYEMPFQEGINFVDYVTSLRFDDVTDLSHYNLKYLELEDIIKSRGSDVIFPDLATFSNIVVNSDGDFKFLDYDGLQLEDISSITLSRNLGFVSSKFIVRNNPIVFNKNIDKKSLIHLYFWMVFGTNLGYVGDRVGTSVVKLDDIFQMINLDDFSIKSKVSKVFYGESDGEYFGEDVYKLADKYNLVTEELDGCKYKKLVRK